jgi:hypothetical protein
MHFYIVLEKRLEGNQNLNDSRHVITKCLIPVLPNHILVRQQFSTSPPPPPFNLESL